MERGPPESPLHPVMSVINEQKLISSLQQFKIPERPPTVDVQMFEGVIIPKTAPQAAFVITGIVVHLTTADVAADESEVRPNPEMVAVSPTKSSVPVARAIG